MSLRAQAELDLATTLEGPDWGEDITLRSPGGVEAVVKGAPGDIGAKIDPGTGTLVAGRQVHVTLRQRSVETAFPGEDLPHGVSDPLREPWRAFFRDVQGTQHSYKVVESMPDRELGMLTFLCEHYADLTVPP